MEIKEAKITIEEKQIISMEVKQSNTNTEVKQSNTSTEVKQPKVIMDVKQQKPLKIISWNVNGLQGIIKKDIKGDKQTRPLITNCLSNLIKKEEPDILCLQEIRCSNKFQWNPSPLSGLKYVYATYSENKKGYSGTLIASRFKPLNVHYGLDGIKEKEGRMITLEFNNYYLINIYTPNIGRTKARLNYRTKIWEPALLSYINNFNSNTPKAFSNTPKASNSNTQNIFNNDAINITNNTFKDVKDEKKDIKYNSSSSNIKGGENDGEKRDDKCNSIDVKDGEKKDIKFNYDIKGDDNKGDDNKSDVSNKDMKENKNHKIKPIILIGDMNCIHTILDINLNSRYESDIAGASKEEKQCFSTLLGYGNLIDTFRHLYPLIRKYSWGSMSMRKSGQGCRLDYCLISKSFAPSLVKSDILNYPGSDHLPITVELNDLLIG